MSAANYDNAKRILQNSEAKISQSPEGIFDQNAVVIFWDNIEARFINECVNYLNDLNEQPVLAGPTQFYDTLFEESLYHLHAYYDEDADRPDPSLRQQRIYRILMRNPVSYNSDNWGETSTRWKLDAGTTTTKGPSSLLTLSMANVTVEAALSFELQEFVSDTFTDSIYLLRGIKLTGTWYSIRRKAEVSAKTGLYTLYWFLSKNDVTEYYFRVQDTATSVRGYLYLWDTAEAALTTLLETKLFDGDGYEVTAGGHTLQEVVPGRVVQVRPLNRDEQDLLLDFAVEIIWYEGKYISYVRTVTGTKNISGRLTLKDMSDSELAAFMGSQLFSADGRRLIL